MTGIHISQTADRDATGTLTGIWIQEAVIPVRREFHPQTIATVTARSFSDACLPDQELATLQATAENFSLVEFRPEDRSGPQLRTEYDGRPFGTPFTYEIDSDTHHATQDRAGAFLFREIRDFPCK